MKEIGNYVNGNTIVYIYEDGTKVRYIKEGEKPEPEFPESIDLKITNRCDLHCEFCAENSVPIGSHADLNDPLLKTIHPYTELAIGGGNPLEHPQLESFLKEMHMQKVICNLTVNVHHYLLHRDLLEKMTNEKLIYGLGISIPDEIPQEFDWAKNFPNAVIHTIAGYTPIETYKRLENKNLNLLILGYKIKGRGASCAGENSAAIISNTLALSNEMLSMKPKFKAIAFDNLAIIQLMVRNKMNAAEYQKLYMGDDGEFTMYIDMVNKKFAASSTHPLHQINTSTVTALFQQVKLQKGE